MKNIHLLSVLILMFFSVSSHASSTFQYTGNNFGAFRVDLNAEGLTLPAKYDHTMNVTGTIEIFMPLHANMDSYELDPGSFTFTFSDGIKTISSETGYVVRATISTNQFREITGWNFRFENINAIDGGLDGHIEIANNINYLDLFTSYGDSVLTYFDEGYMHAFSSVPGEMVKISPSSVPSAGRL